MATENPIASALKKVGLGFIAVKDNGGVPDDIQIVGDKLEWTRDTKTHVPGRVGYGAEVDPTQKATLVGAGVPEVKSEG